MIRDMMMKTAQTNATVHVGVSFRLLSPAAAGAILALLN
jgi:hypothetical protein